MTLLLSVVCSLIKLSQTEMDFYPGFITLFLVLILTHSCTLERVSVSLVCIALLLPTSRLLGPGSFIDDFNNNHNKNLKQS